MLACCGVASAGTGDVGVFLFFSRNLWWMPGDFVINGSRAPDKYCNHLVLGRAWLWL